MGGVFSGKEQDATNGIYALAGTCMRILCVPYSGYVIYFVRGKFSSLSCDENSQ